MVLNLLLLFGVTVVPFPTAVLASQLGHPGQKTAAILFNGTYVVIAIFFNVLWRYASKGRRLLHAGVNLAEVDKITRQYAFGPAVYLLCLVLVWISVPASMRTKSRHAIAAACPMRHQRKPSSYISITRLVVLRSGPPCVIT